MVQRQPLNVGYLSDLYIVKAEINMPFIYHFYIGVPEVAADNGFISVLRCSAILAI